MIKMRYAIELYFDKEFEEKILKLPQKLADNNLTTMFLEWKTRPHITLAVFNDIDESRCIELLKDFAEKRTSIPAFLDSVGMFNDTKTIFLNPTMTKSMYQLHADLHTALSEFDTKGWDWYLPDGWVPHCTVALTSEDEEDVFYKASELILREFEKMEGKYTAFGLVKITFPVEELAVIPLGK